MAEEAAVKTWSRRFKLITAAAAALTAAIGVATSAFNSYQSLQEAKQARLDARTSYEALVAKVNSMAERLAYLEGRATARAHDRHAPPELPASAPEIHTELMIDHDGVADTPPRQFKIDAYQQLPASLGELTDTQEAYKK